MQQLAKPRQFQVRVGDTILIQEEIRCRNALRASAGCALAVFDIAQADIRVLAHAVETFPHSSVEHRLALHRGRRALLRVALAPFQSALQRCRNPRFCGEDDEPPPKFSPQLPPDLAADFREAAGDFYPKAATRIRNRSPRDKQERNCFKSIILGIVNGKGPPSLARDLACTEPEARRRRERQDAYLKQVRGRLARREAAGEADTSRAETLRALEDRVLASRSHDLLFVNGRGLPLRQNNNLLREFRHDLKRAGVDPTGLDLHALRHTCNTLLQQGGVKPTIVRARMGHTTARMTDVYTDVDAVDQGGNTAPVAALLGMAADDVEPGVAAGSAAQGPAALTLDPEDILRPTPAVLAALVERYSNVLIARICKVSEMAVRNWLKAAGLIRPRRMVSPMLPEFQVVLLRADLRAALAEESARQERRHTKESP